MESYLINSSKKKPSVKINSWCPPDTQNLGGKKQGKGKSAQPQYFNCWCFPTALSCCVSVENFGLPRKHLPLHFQRQKAGPSLFQEIISHVLINFHTQNQREHYLSTRTRSQRKLRSQGMFMDMTPNHEGKKEWDSIAVLPALPWPPLLMWTPLQSLISFTRDKIASDSQPDALQHLVFIKQAGKLHPPEVLTTWKGDLFQIKQANLKFW